MEKESIRAERDGRMRRFRSGERGERESRFLPTDCELWFVSWMGKSLVLAFSYHHNKVPENGKNNNADKNDVVTKELEKRLIHR
jgi:hypothetical protein